MKFPRLALAALLLVPASALFVRAEDDDDKEKPDDIPNFGNLDEFIYQPKSNATLGERFITGVKASFRGGSHIAAPEAVPVQNGTGFIRTYHDGFLDPDTRTVTEVNPNGVTTAVPITPDGKTNTWSYDTNGQINAAGTGTTSQLTPDGYMQFHVYSADTSGNTGIYSKQAKGTTGVELATSRDLFRLGKHATLGWFGGVSLNDIQASRFSTVNANITTVTDTYNLFGQAVPNGPYQAPSSIQQNIILNGVDVVDQYGNNIIQKVDTTVLIGNQPLNRTTTVAADATEVTDHWKLHGAYLTLRTGPQFTYKFNEHLKLVLSGGPALIAASSTYTVNEAFTPNTGGQIVATYQDIEDKYIPALYADATVEYDLNDKAGFYLGAFYQDAGHYTQSIDGYANLSATSNGSFSTKVDFNGQDGVRGGMSFKF
jgi:hypothetical protein